MLIYGKNTYTSFSSSSSWFLLDTACLAYGLDIEHACYNADQTTGINNRNYTTRHTSLSYCCYEKRILNSSELDDLH